MSLDHYLTDVPDDDPHGDAQLERELAESCPDCGVDGQTPCLPFCGCAHCRRKDLDDLGGDEPPKEAA